MIIQIAELVQQSGLAEFLRNSLWLYPLVNTGHIIGIALLVGSALAMDCRLLGCWPSIRLKSVITVFQTLAFTGIILTTTCGLLLFITSPVDYLQSDIFIAKIALIFIALTNAITLRLSASWKNVLIANNWGIQPKVQALISLLLWLTIVFLGRLIGYR